MSDRPVEGGPRENVPAKTSGLAVASLILGLLFFVPPAPLVGLILGIFALMKISASGGQIGGRGMAIAGIVLGSIFVVFACMMAPMAAILIPSFSRAKEQAQAVGCRANLKQLGYSIGMYQTDFDEFMPPDIETLCVRGYLKTGINKDDTRWSRLRQDTVLTCPAGGEPIDTADIDGTCSYIYARVKEPWKMMRPGTIPIMWDRKKWHGVGVNVLYADLHVEFNPYDVLEQQIEDSSQLYEKPPPMPEELPPSD